MLISGYGTGKEGVFTDFERVLDWLSKKDRDVMGTAGVGNNLVAVFGARCCAGVSYRENKPVGIVASLPDRRDNHCSIHLAVLSSWRRQGVGEEMFGCLVRTCESNIQCPAKKLYLTTTSEAVKVLAARCGFTHENEWLDLRSYSRLRKVT